MKNILAIMLLGVSTTGLGQGKILIAAASDLKFAMDAVIQSFEQAHEAKVDVTYGSSGKLTEQILYGAPFDVLLSADISYPEKLARENQTGSKIYSYARGRIVLWSRKINVEQTEMNGLLDASVEKIAIANPRHAPYGARAMEALKYYQIDQKISSKLVFGENISQTAQFATTGVADVAIIALSMALSPNVKKQNGTWFLIPEQSHSPLIQGAVVTRHGERKELAHTFLEYLKNPDAVAILKGYGFTIP